MLLPSSGTPSVAVQPILRDLIPPLTSNAVLPPFRVGLGRQDWLPFSPASIVPARGCRGTLPVGADPAQPTEVCVLGDW